MKSDVVDAAAVEAVEIDEEILSQQQQKNIVVHTLQLQPKVVTVVVVGAVESVDYEHVEQKLQEGDDDGDAEMEHVGKLSHQDLHQGAKNGE